jgi:hypothetical protein
MDLPEHPIPDVDTKLHGQLQHDPLNTHAYDNSDWETCIKTHRSMMGINIKLSGGTIAYKTRLNFLDRSRFHASM